MRKFIFVIQKGGVAKTTSVKSLAAAFSLMGLKVLVIDFDPQANATLGLLEQRVLPEESIYNLIMNPELNWKDYVKIYEKGDVRFDIIPGGNNLAIAEIELAGKAARESRFKRILSKIEAEGDYDVCLVDCQPSLGLLVINVLCSSSDNELVICARPDEDSQEAIRFLFNSITSLKEDVGIMPKSFKILVTQLMENQLAHRQNLNMIEKNFPENLLQTQIEKDTSLEKARTEKMDIFNYDSGSRAANQYMRVAKELLGEK